MNEWRIRPRAASRVVTVAYGIVVGLPLGVMLTAGVFFLMSYRPVHVVFVVAAVFCAVIGPLLVLLVPLGLKSAANVELVVTPTDLLLLDESGRPARVLSYSRLSVWRVTLPAAVTASNVPSFPQQVTVVSSPRASIVLGREWRRDDLDRLWKYLGVTPANAGRMTQKELNTRFPGAADTLVDTARSAGIWFRVYLVCVAALVLYIAAATVIGI